MKHDGWEALDLCPKGWNTYYFTGWSAVVPENDLRAHEEDNLRCPCGPRWDQKTRVLLHHAFDGRDLIERVEAGKRIA